MSITINGSGSISGLTAGAGVPASALSGQVPDANAPSGSVIQVVSVAKTDTFSMASNSFSDITGLSINITPMLSSSRFLLMANIVVGVTGGNNAMFRFMRDSTPVGIGDSAGSKLRGSAQSRSGDTGACVTIAPVFLDSPNTASQITYKLQMAMQDSATGYLNRTADDNDGTNRARTISTITIMEIAA